MIPEPKQGTPQADWIVPVHADANFSKDTLGTQPLPANTDEFNVTRMCIKGYKYNPYIYKVKPPLRESLGPIPDPSPSPADDPPYYWCRSITPPVSGIGIWVVGLISHCAQKLPVAPLGREAVFEPDDSILGEQHDWRQPYLILSDDPRPQYVSYYDCTGWNSIVEVMNLQHWTAECIITVYDRFGNSDWEQKLLLRSHETKRIYLDKHVPKNEGLIVVEPLKHGWDFPSILCIAPSKVPSGLPRIKPTQLQRFVPFIRVP